MFGGKKKKAKSLHMAKNIAQIAQVRQGPFSLTCTLEVLQVQKGTYVSNPHRKFLIKSKLWVALKILP